MTKSFSVKVNKHPRRKNNVQVNVMYELYLAGRSLAEIAAMYHKTRQAVYDVFRSRGYKLRSKQLMGLKIINGHRFTLMKGGYLRGTVNGRRMLAHHLVWEKRNGPIPPGYGIHFKNGIRTDVSIDNLSLHTIAEISSKFSPHLNQFTSPTGSRKHKVSVRDRVRAEREERWKRAIAIG
jgi:hypothetical protein